MFDENGTESKGEAVAWILNQSATITDRCYMKNLIFGLAI